MQAYWVFINKKWESKWYFGMRQLLGKNSMSFATEFTVFDFVPVKWGKRQKLGKQSAFDYAFYWFRAVDTNPCVSMYGGEGQE